MTREKVHQLLDQARQKQIDKHGQNNISSKNMLHAERFLILTEEVGELAGLIQEIVRPSYANFETKEFLIEELCDVLGCAAGWLESIDVPE